MGPRVLPAHGDEVRLGDRAVGWVGTAAQHHELGPVATVILKRSADPTADLVIVAAEGQVAAAQQVVVAPGGGGEAGRPARRRRPCARRR